MSVEVHAEDRSCTVTTPDDLDQVLDDLTSTAGAAVLVELRAPGALLHIGIGHPEASVGLYLDAELRPYFAQSSGPRAAIGDLVFHQATDRALMEGRARASQHSIIHTHGQPAPATQTGGSGFTRFGIP